MLASLLIYLILILPFLDITSAFADTATSKWECVHIIDDVKTSELLSLKGLNVMLYTCNTTLQLTYHSKSLSWASLPTNRSTHA